MKKCSPWQKVKHESWTSAVGYNTTSLADLSGVSTHLISTISHLYLKSFTFSFTFLLLLFSALGNALEYVPGKCYYNTPINILTFYCTTMHNELCDFNSSFSKSIQQSEMLCVPTICSDVTCSHWFFMFTFVCCCELSPLSVILPFTPYPPPPLPVLRLYVDCKSSLVLMRETIVKRLGKFKTHWGSFW